MRYWVWWQLILFQLLWFSAVIGQNQWLVLSGLLLIMHFVMSPKRQQDWRIIPLALIGIGVDSLLIMTGVFAFDGLPFWLGLLWMGFVLSLGHSLSWLRRIPPWLLLPLGAFSGCLSYLAGWKLDAVEFPLGAGWTAITIGLLWAILVPMLVNLDKRLRVST